jgi:hypothetical protein
VLASDVTDDADRSTDTASDGSAAARFSVLEAATADRMQAVPEETKQALQMITSAPLPGNGKARLVSAMGIVALPSAEK